MNIATCLERPDAPTPTPPQWGSACALRGLTQRWPGAADAFREAPLRGPLRSRPPAIAFAAV